MNLEIGSTVGDYQIVGVLGAGGMGKVYKVRSVISDRIEAMKVLLPDLANEPDLADRFLREIKVQASLEHPNIAALHTALRVDNQLLMLMEFVEGVTLEQQQKNGPLPMGDAVNYVMQALSALEYAHARGVIHRDIKPANMMLTPDGIVKLMDFGIAKGAADRKLTMTGTTMGSLYYMSPEQIQGAATLDSRSDLYSIGVSLYELVTGKRPFDGDSQFAIMAAHLEKLPAPPISLDPRLPQLLNDVILMSVSKDPNARFQTAGAFRNALSNLAPAGQAAAAPRATVPPVRMPTAVTPPGPVARPHSKRGLWMGLGALATALIVVGVIQFGPKKGAKAEPPTTPPPVVQPAPAAVTPPPSAAPPAAVAPTPQPVVEPQPAPSQPQAAPVAAKPQPKAPPAPIRNVPPQNLPPAHAGSSPAPAVVVAQPQAPVSTQPPAPQPQAPAPAAPAVNRAELQQAREQLVMLGSRAGGIHSSLQTLQRTQAASGLNLRGDMQEANSLMGTFLDGANAALNAGDLPAAKSLMDKAERQIEKLEKFLNR